MPRAAKPKTPTKALTAVTAASAISATPHRPPSMDRLLSQPSMKALQEAHGKQQLQAAANATLDAWRKSAATQPFDLDAFVHACLGQLESAAASSLRRTFNLTGTVLHTNLGRAPMAPEAVAAVNAVMQGACNLEFDLGKGRRGDRDDHVEGLLRELTGAQAATVVNNNAAAVLLVIAALAQGKEAIVSRGELVEIGGSFRIPDIMRRAKAKLVEVGTTNRTHLKDFAEAIHAKTGLVMKVHTSNYVIQGFTASVPPAELAALCAQRKVPFMEDLGSGALVDMTAYHLPAEPMPQQSLAAGVNVVTFSGDKLLGGPQCGLIVGDADCLAAIKRHPLKRALRVDKMTLAALEATLKLYRDPDRLVQRLPTLRVLTRGVPELQAQAERLAPKIAKALGPSAEVKVQSCKSQIGSGSLPVERLPSVAITIAATPALRQGRGRWLQALTHKARQWSIPVVGRIEDDQWWLDLRTLEPSDEDTFVALWPEA
jgi:L-seryl-tRNA(Ser) seleniumtransferase